MKHNPFPGSIKRELPDSPFSPWPRPDRRVSLAQCCTEERRGFERRASTPHALSLNGLGNRCSDFHDTPRGEPLTPAQSALLHTLAGNAPLPVVPGTRAAGLDDSAKVIASALGLSTFPDETFGSEYSDDSEQIRLSQQQRATDRELSIDPGEPFPGHRDYKDLDDTSEF